MLIHYCGGSCSRSHFAGCPALGLLRLQQNKYSARNFSGDDLQRPPIESAGQIVYLVAPSSSGSALRFPAGRVQRSEHNSACSRGSTIPEQPTTGCSSLKQQLFHFKVLLKMQTPFPLGFFNLFFFFFGQHPSLITTGESWNSQLTTPTSGQT